MLCFHAVFSMETVHWSMDSLVRTPVWKSVHTVCKQSIHIVFPYSILWSEWACSAHHGGCMDVREHATSKDSGRFFCVRTILFLRTTLNSVYFLNSSQSSVFSLGLCTLTVSYAGRAIFSIQHPASSSPRHAFICAIDPCGVLTCVRTQTVASTGAGYLADLLAYSPASNVWTVLSPSGSGPTARNDMGLAAVASGLLYIFGGNDGGVCTDCVPSSLQVRLFDLQR